jgi:hypothetical protein
MFVRVYSVSVLSCVGRGLATGLSLVQGVLSTVYKGKITEPHKEEAKSRYRLEHHWRRRTRSFRFLPNTWSGIIQLKLSPGNIKSDITQYKINSIDFDVNTATCIWNGWSIKHFKYSRKHSCENY